MPSGYRAKAELKREKEREREREREREKRNAICVENRYYVTNLD